MPRSVRLWAHRHCLGALWSMTVHSLFAHSWCPDPRGRYRHRAPGHVDGICASRQEKQPMPARSPQRVRSTWPAPREAPHASPGAAPRKASHLKLSSLVSPPRVASLEDPPALARCRGLRSARPAERDGIKHADHAVVADRWLQSVIMVLQLFITLTSVARRSRRRKIFMMHECHQ